MSEAEAVSARFSERTAWARSLETPLRTFLRTESGSSVILLGATIAALVWANADLGSYHDTWSTKLAIRIAHSGVTLDLRQWLNAGLMTFFFFVVGLEARREFDLGELRERRRGVLPVLSGLGGLTVPILIYLAFNAGRASAHGWGAAMSTDTAFALGMLALVGPRFPARLRAFMLTALVVDDLVALLVIAVAYTGHVHTRALVAALALFAGVVTLRILGVRRGPVYAVLGACVWVALLKSGVDPIVTGLAIGLMAPAYTAGRSDLERATDLFRRFREQPTPELARTARLGLQTALSPNDRLQQLWHPWTSYAIVPLFALANAGIALNGEFLRRAFASPVTLGIIVGYVVGKPLGVFGAAWLGTRLSHGRLQPSVGWAAVAGGGTIAGIGFTVSILIASLAFHGAELDEAKVGVLAAALSASLLTWLLFRATDLMPPRLRIRALAGTAALLVDLAEPVDPESDHVRGPEEAKVTLVEYGDFECPYCGRAEPVIRELLSDFGDLRYVWRHLPLSDVHPHTQLAAEAAEAAGAQGAFWEMSDLLFAHQNALEPDDLVGYAEQLGLDLDRFTEDLGKHEHAARVARDVDSADLSGVSGTPTFFINGRRHYGAYDLETLSSAVRAAGARASFAAT